MSLDDDTNADRLFRFTLGALIGGGGGWLYSARWSVMDTGAFVLTLAVPAVAVGLLAVAFGNRFLEWVIRERWW